MDVLNKISDELVVPQIPQDDRMISPWLRTTRWHENIGSHPTEALRRMVAMPEDGEGLEKLKRSVEVYFEKALALIATADELTLQRLNSPDPVKSGISNTPFHKHQQRETMQRYLFPMVALLAMLIRSNSDDPYHIPMPDYLDKLVDNLDLSVAQDSPCDQAVTSDIIHQIFMYLWQTKWERTETNPIPDPTERCLALLTLHQDGSFKEPKDVTGIIAKDEYCMRLAFLTEIKHRVASGDAADESVAFNDLEPYLIEKTHFTFARLRSLQHRASALAYDTMSLPRILWTDDSTFRTMLYKGNRVDLDDVCKMFADTEAKLVEAWESSVLKGVHIRIDYDSIADDLTNKDVGYSFLSDQRNSCFARRDRLLRAFFTNTRLFSHFAVVRQGEIIWNRAALTKWLQDYADFHSLLLLRCEMLSGAPGRGTELTAMTYRNTRTRPTRNLVLLGKHITMLCLYSKTSALTGKDKLIPHSLDTITGDILIQDLALARPFAEFAASICFPNHTHIMELYRQHIFIRFDRLFNSSDLSSVMTQHSLPFLHYNLTINSWRHIQTTWKRKYRCSMEALMEEETEDTVEALQAGHSRATENRIYGLSVQALAGAAEDVLPLFLNASTTWQIKCKTVPGGTLLPYNQARNSDNEPTPSLAPDLRQHTGMTSNRMPGTSTEDIARTVFQHLMPDLTKVIKAAVNDALTCLSHTHGILAHQSLPDEGKDQEKSHAMCDSHTGEIFETDGSGEDIVPTPERLITNQDIPVSARYNTLVEALDVMKRLLQDGTISWASKQQQQAMSAVLQKKTDVVAILRTGGGKSMLAIIPSILEQNSATVLILPLNSLMIDFEQRLKRMGVPFQIYDPRINDGNLNIRDNLILVTADKCRTAGWRESIAILNEQKPIARFVYDEAHLPLIARDYRKTLDHVYDIRSLPAQIVLLSGTVPLSSEEDLKISFNLGLTTIVPEIHYIGHGTYLPAINARSVNGK
ncbi:hypothetical protein BD769DRAFT_1352930 [Suillus cothurnatus]|nr:hypothetical protein BD769DRAFT_1352930 [Suillus cothurnatus]